jgi:hypothetical protein
MKLHQIPTASITSLHEQITECRTLPATTQSLSEIKILRHAILHKAADTEARLQTIEKAIKRSKNCLQMKALREERRQVSNELDLVKQYGTTH